MTHDGDKGVFAAGRQVFAVRERTGVQQWRQTMFVPEQQQTREALPRGACSRGAWKMGLSREQVRPRVSAQHFADFVNLAIWHARF